MNQTRFSGFEDGFREEDDSLAGFYETESLLSVEDDEDLYPILSSIHSEDERYEEIGFLAEGAEKRITRVLDRLLNREVAMARPVHSETREHQEHFLREAYLEANLTHPNIMPIHNVGMDENDIPFFTMELVSGDNLKTIIDKLREKDEVYAQLYSLDQRLSIFLKVCDAIAYAHSRNVLHLDIKPGNIRVGPFGEVLVCDWGIARVLFDETVSIPDMRGKLNGDVLNDLTLAGTIKGSPGFMAPEQTTANGEKSKQTDIYALGAMLYVLLTLELPVRGTSGNEIVQNTREGNVISPHRRVEHRVPSSLAAVAMKALSFDPKERYVSVRELQVEINRYLSGYPTRSERAGMVTRFAFFMKRHSRVASLLILFLLLLAIVVSVDLATIRNEKAVALAAQHQAETNLELYLEEQREVMALNSDLQDATIAAVRAAGYLNLDLLLRVLDQGKERDFKPAEYESLMAQTGIVLFMRHRFNQANDYFDRAGDQISGITEILKLSEKYAVIKPDDLIPLTLKQMTELVGDYTVKNTRMNLIINYLYLNFTRQYPPTSPEECLPLSEAMLVHLNDEKPPVESLMFTIRNGGRHLDLSGMNYRTFRLRVDLAYNENILSHLKLDSLDISNMPLSAAAELNGLKLQELRMVGVQISNKNLPAVLEKIGLKKLIISAGAFPDWTMKRLREKFEVIEE